MSGDDRARGETARRWREQARGLGRLELAAGVRALARAGLVRLAQGSGGWDDFCAALAGVAEIDVMLAAAVAMDTLAADLIARWSTCANMEIFTRINRGEEIAAVVGDGVSPRAARAPEAGEDALVVEGDGGLVVFGALTDRLIAVAALESGTCLAAFKPNDPGVLMETPPGEETPRERHGRRVSFRGAHAPRSALIGPRPLPEAEPAAYLARRSLALAAVGWGWLAAEEEGGVLDPTLTASIAAAASAIDAGTGEAEVLCARSLALVEAAVRSKVLGKGGRTDILVCPPRSRKEGTDKNVCPTFILELIAACRPPFPPFSPLDL